jgi:hypothetical protein
MADNITLGKEIASLWGLAEIHCTREQARSLAGAIQQATDPTVGIILNLTPENVLIDFTVA